MHISITGFCWQGLHQRSPYEPGSRNGNDSFPAASHERSSPVHSHGSVGAQNSGAKIRSVSGEQGEQVANPRLLLCLGSKVGFSGFASATAWIWEKGPNAA